MVVDADDADDQRESRTSSIHELYRTHFAEAERDQVDSSFTEILREGLESCLGALAFVFVDSEGETIDYASRLDPYEAKVAGAQVQLVERQLTQLMEALGGEGVIRFSIFGDHRDFVGARVSESYFLLGITLAGGATPIVDSVLEWMSARLRAEAGLAAPAWDPAGRLSAVEVREARGWPFAPVAYRRDGERHVVADVLGRWRDSGRLAGPLDCFRVRLSSGEEHTLAHDPKRDTWHYRE